MERNLVAAVSGYLINWYELFCNASTDTCFDG